MTIGIIDRLGTASAIIDHANDVVLSTGTQDSFLAEEPLINIDNLKQDVIVLNTCIGVKNFLLNEKARKIVLTTLGIEQGIEASTLFAIFNGVKFSEWLEVSYSTKFMNNEVGPSPCFITGTGIKPEINVKEAVPQIDKITRFLTDIKYKGELCLSITKDFTVCNISFGHFYGHFAMFAEILKSGKVSNLLEFMLGKSDVCELYESIVVSNLVTLPPFPYQLTIATPKITAPPTAEKHLWRMRQGILDVVLITTQGSRTAEARKRLRRTLDNMTNYNKELQFRTDYGQNCQFVLAEEQYQKFNQPWVQQQNHVVIPSKPVEQILPASIAQVV